MQPISINITINVGSDGSVSVKAPPPTPVKQAVIDDEPVPPVDPSDAFSMPGLEPDPYGIKQEPIKPTPAEPVDALTELSRALVWLDTTQDAMEVAKTILEYHPKAAQDLAQANSVEDLDKIITGLGTTKASEVGGRIREQPTWAGKFIVRLRIGLGMGPPTGLKAEPETSK